MGRILLARTLTAIPERRGEASAQVEIAVRSAEHGTTIERLAALAEQHNLRSLGLLGSTRSTDLERAVAAWEAILKHAHDPNGSNSRS